MTRGMPAWPVIKLLQKPREDVMKEAPCAQCGRLYAEDELVRREDNGALVCPDCSGLLTGEDLTCRYDETG